MHGQHLDVGMYSNLELVQLLSIRKDNVHAIIKDSVENGLKERWEKLQPPQSRANRDKRVEVKFSERARKPLEEDEIQFVESLIDILSTDRCESYPEWIRVGWCLFNISEQLYDLWDQWSQNSIKYEESADNCVPTSNGGRVIIIVASSWFSDPTSMEISEVLTELFQPSGTWAVTFTTSSRLPRFAKLIGTEIDPPGTAVHSVFM